MQFNFIVRAVVVIAFATVGYGCSPAGKSAALLVELNGTHADFGVAALAGAQLAAARGDVKAVTSQKTFVPITLVQGDIANSPTAVAQQLQPECIVGIGCNDSDTALAVVPTFTRAGKPFMIIGASDPKLPNQCGRNVFMACFGDDAQAHAAALYAGKTFGKRAVLVFDSKLDYTRGLSRYFADFFTKLRGSIVARIDLRDADAGANIAALATKDGVDFVYLATDPSSFEIALALIRAVLPTTPIMGGDGLDCSYLDLAPAHLTDRVYFTTHAWFGMGATPEALAFAQAYTNAYGTPPPNGFAALGYDATMMVQMAMNTAGESAITTPADVAKAIGKIQGYRGASGTISYTDGPVPRKDVWILRMNKGRRGLATRIPSGDL